MEFLLTPTSSVSEASEPEVDGAISRLVEMTYFLVVATANGFVNKEHKVANRTNRGTDATTNLTPPSAHSPAP
jgi:hypothetical protein